MTFMAFPVIFGPMTLKATLSEPSTTTKASTALSARSRDSSFLRVPRKSLDRSTGALRPMNGPPRWPAWGRPPGPRP